VSQLSPLARVVRYRAALGLIAARFLKVRYRRSVLGFAWSFAYPLLAATVLTVVFGPLFSQVPDYAIYVLVGLLAWHFFSVSCMQAMDALLGSASVSRKVYVPTAVFPLAAVSANLINLLLCLVAIPIVLAATGGTPTLRPVVFVAGLAMLAAFTAGIALGLSALNVFFQDVRYLFEALLLVWFYATPVMYPVAGRGPEVAVLVGLNPLHWILVVLRAALWSGGAVSAFALVIGVAVATAALVGGWLAFCIAERRFHQYL
jgi:lipopolysaccharide transport system permease protein